MRRSLYSILVPGFILCISLLLSSCSSCSSLYVPQLPEVPSYERVNTTHIPYPVILLHGLGQKSHAWDGSAVQFYEREMGLTFGGVLSMKNGKASVDSKSGGTGDFYTVSFSLAYDSVATWGRELEQYVNLVRQKTKASHVILIGYSMGGLASRYYLTHHLYDHHVKRLITIGTPHLGSPFANVWTIKTGLNAKIKDANVITAPVYKGALSVLTTAETDVPFDSPAVGDLRRPEDGGYFLDALGKAEHPGDVDYVCVVGNVDVAGEVQKLNASAVQDVLRRALEFMGSGNVSTLLSTGDGVVSSYSQTLNNIPYFKNNLSRQRLTRTVTLGSLHTDHLQNSNEIQRVTLEDKPEFKGAEFYNVGGKASLVVDFSDYLPPQKSTVSISYPSIAGERSVKANDVQLIRTKNGEVLCRAIFPLGDVDFAQAFGVNISITNYFNNKATATKQWMGKR